MPRLIRRNEREKERELTKENNSAYERRSDLVFETVDRDGKRAEATLLETEEAVLFSRLSRPM